MGAGLAGERVAVEAAQAGFSVICLSLVPPRRSHSSAAMGGMQAALGNSIMGDGDSPEIHFNDTVKGSDWGCDQEVARLFAKTAPIAMREMAWMGVPWSRVVPGEHTYYKGGKPFQATEKAENEGLIHSRAFGGTAKWRTCYTSDGTGHAVLFTLDNRLLQLGVDVHDRVQAEALVHDGERCMGCVARDLRTGELRPGRPEEYILNAIVTEYDPAFLVKDDPCPETNKFLLSSMDGDQELVDFIWRLLGYGLVTERRDHIFTIFWGEHGRNGKDTLIKLVTHVLGQTLSGDVPVEMFLQMQQTRNSSAPSPDVLALRGMCIAWINEAEEGQRFALAKLKKLTGGGYVTARGLQDKQQTTWLQTHLPIMTTNELPKAKADDAAFWARAVLVKWPLSFVEEPQQPYERPADKDLYEKICAEAKGVLARMVRGCMEYLRDGLKIPDKVKAWTREQRASWDDVGLFIGEWCEQEPHRDNPDAYKTRITSTDLHEAFCIWYARNRDKRFSISAKKFAEMLNKKDIPYKRSNGSWRLGIRLNAEGENALADYRAEK